MVAIVSWLPMRYKITYHGFKLFSISMFKLRIFETSKEPVAVQSWPPWPWTSFEIGQPVHSFSHNCPSMSMYGIVIPTSNLPHEHGPM